MRKVLALALTVVMLLSLVVVGASAAETNVAKIIKADTTERGTYTNIASAAIELQDGDTLEILEPVGAFSVAPEGKTITITASGNGKMVGTLTILQSSSGIRGTVNIKDLTIEHALKGNNAISTQGYNTVNIENVTIKVTAASGNSMCLNIGSNYTGVVMNVKNSYIYASGGSYIAYFRSGNDVTFDNCQIINEGTKNTINVDKNYGGGSLTIKNSYAVGPKGVVNVSCDTPDNRYKVYTENSTFVYTTTGSSILYSGKKVDFCVKNVTAVSSNGGYFINTKGNVELISATIVNSSSEKAMYFVAADAPGYCSSSIVAPSSANNYSTLTWNLGEKKIEAESAINQEAGATQSATMQEIVSTAIADVWAQTNNDDVAAAKTRAITAIQAQKALENPAPTTGDNSVWFVVVAVVALLGTAIVSKKATHRI